MSWTEEEAFSSCFGNVESFSYFSWWVRPVPNQFAISVILMGFQQNKQFRSVCLFSLHATLFLLDLPHKLLLLDYWWLLDQFLEKPSTRSWHHYDRHSTHLFLLASVVSLKTKQKVFYIAVACALKMAPFEQYCKWNQWMKFL